MLESLTTTLEEYLVKKAPALPANIKELLVQFAPWIAIIAVVFSVPAVFAFLGLSAMLYSSAGFTYALAIIFLVISLILRGLSVPGLLARTKNGWEMLYYSTLVGAAYSLLSFDFVGLIVGTLLSLYLVFQVRGYYK